MWAGIILIIGSIIFAMPQEYGSDKGALAGLFLFIGLLLALSSKDF